jgi:hypothetical protein
MECKKVFFFEKKNQKTFVTLGHGLRRRQRPKEPNMCPWPPKNPVMPAKAPRGAPRGIHDFSFSITKALDPGTAKKSWMPAFAGMTGERAGTKRSLPTECLT